LFSARTGLPERGRPAAAERSCCYSEDSEGSDLFETRVKVELGQRKGKIVVEFATIDDLERIVKAMSPEVSGSEPSESSE
jgi:hypothetical protein